MQEQKIKPNSFLKIPLKKEAFLNKLLRDPNCGSIGIVISIFKYLNSTYEYYVDTNSPFFLSLKETHGLEEDDIRQVLEPCFQMDMFNKTLFEKYGILTSEEIQRKWQEIARYENRRGVSIKSEYLLIPEKDVIVHQDLYEAICQALAE